MGGKDFEHRDDIFSKAVRAGKRTYFFDVKATRGNDYYLTITESKRRIDDAGKFHYDKHKLFLYKEDFEKFSDGLSEVLDFIRGEKGDDFGIEPREEHVAAKEDTASTENATSDSESKSNEEYSSDISFDDLGGEEKEG